MSDLERPATALWVQCEMPRSSTEEQAGRLNEIKPHVSLTEAAKALQKIEGMEREAAALVSA